MRGIVTGMLAVLIAVSLLAQDGPDRMLLRVAAEAQTFLDAARGIVATETLTQKARKRHTRFKLRIADDNTAAPEIRYVTRQIVSEYGFTTFEEAPESLHELRQVISVDGREVVDHDKARTTLTMGATSADDKVKKRILQRFEKHGLETAATDFGQMILLFLRPSLSQYDFKEDREAFLGAEATVVYRYRQRGGPESFTIFEDRTATKERMQGELWVRKSDGVPLRVTMKISIGDDQQRVVHESVVDYFKSALGPVLPASVCYVQHINGELFVENIAEYSDYEIFDRN